MDEEKLSRRDGEWWDAYTAALTGFCSQTPVATVAGNVDVSLLIASTAARVADASVMIANRLSQTTDFPELTEACDKHCAKLLD